MIPRRPIYICRRFGTLYLFHLQRQTPGNHPKENKQHSEHGESLKSRIPRNSVYIFRQRHLLYFKTCYLFFFYVSCNSFYDTFLFVCSNDTCYKLHTKISIPTQVGYRLSIPIKLYGNFCEGVYTFTFPRINAWLRRSLKLACVNIDCYISYSDCGLIVDLYFKVGKVVL